MEFEVNDSDVAGARKSEYLRFEHRPVTISHIVQIQVMESIPAVIRQYFKGSLRYLMCSLCDTQKHEIVLHCQGYIYEFQDVPTRQSDLS